MAKEDASLDLLLPRGNAANEQWEFTWDWMVGCHAIFLQRPYSSAHLSAARLARTLGLRIWMDWDDDLAAVRRSNPRYDLYNRDEVQEALRILPQWANVITVTTRALAEKIGRLGSKAEIVVIPNACQWPFTSAPRRPIVTWRGSRHHVENFTDEITKDLLRISHERRFSNWTWHFMGDVPWQAPGCIKEGRLSLFPSVNPFHYMEHFCSLGAWVHIVPLCDNEFNRSKSNLAWLEATAAGAVVVAPNWEEWQRPGIVNYSSLSELGRTLEVLMDEYVGERMHPNVTKSREFIRENLLLGHVNSVRWGVIDALDARVKI